MAPIPKGVLRYLRQRSLVEGVWQGNKGWLVVAAAVWGARGIQKALHREETVLFREVLAPGERILVTEAVTRPTRRQRRASGKASSS